MKAVDISKPGGPEVLEVRDVPKPLPGDREVLVRVHFAGLNRADILQRQGKYPAPAGMPAEIPGLEFAGMVEELGNDVCRWKKGQRVFGIVAGGAQAEFVMSHEDLLIAVPPNLSLEQAAAVPEVFITAHDALRQAEFRSGDAVLIHAVGSGVGLAACQLVYALGGKAFGTSRTAEKIERAREFGLSAGLVVIKNDLSAQLSLFAKETTGGKGFNVVLDLNGGPYFSASLVALATKGRLVLIGTTAGTKSEIELGLLLTKRAKLIGTVLRARPLEEKIKVTQTFEIAVTPLLEQGAIRPVINAVFDIREIRKAHALMESNQTFGKVLLKIASE